MVSDEPVCPRCGAKLEKAWTKSRKSCRAPDIQPIVDTLKCQKVVTIDKKGALTVSQDLREPRTRIKVYLASVPRPLSCRIPAA